jgi:hypothetical protein
MSRTFHHGERHIRVRGVRKDPADLRKLARALIALAQAQAEADAEALADENQPRRKATARGKRSSTQANFGNNPTTTNDGDAA